MPTLNFGSFTAKDLENLNTTAPMEIGDVGEQHPGGDGLPRGVVVPDEEDFPRNDANGQDDEEDEEQVIPQSPPRGPPQGLPQGGRAVRDNAIARELPMPPLIRDIPWSKTGEVLGALAPVLGAAAATSAVYFMYHGFRQASFATPPLCGASGWNADTCVSRVTSYMNDGVLAGYVAHLSENTESLRNGVSPLTLPLFPGGCKAVPVERASAPANVFQRKLPSLEKFSVPSGDKMQKLLKIVGWVQSVKDDMTLQQLSDPQMQVLYASQHFDSGVAVWWGDHLRSATVQSLDQLREALIARYVREDPYVMAFKLFGSLRLVDQPSFEVYDRQLRQLYNTMASVAKPGRMLCDAGCIDMMLSGLLQTKYHEGVVVDPATGLFPASFTRALQLLDATHAKLTVRGTQYSRAASTAKQTIAAQKRAADELREKPQGDSKRRAGPRKTTEQDLGGSSKKSDVSSKPKMSRQDIADALGVDVGVVTTRLKNKVCLKCGKGDHIVAKCPQRNGQPWPPASKN